MSLMPEDVQTSVDAELAALQTPVGADLYRELLASFPAGICVVTAFTPEGEPRGLTLIAFCGVSLEPPLVLVCVDRASHTLPAIQAWTFTHEDARRITQPVLFVLGAESLALMTEVRELVHAWLPQTQDAFVPGASHCLQMEHASAIAEGLAAFFRASPAPAQVEA